MLSPGDELLVPDNVYGPTRKFCDTILKRFGVATRYYDPLAHRREIGEKTRAILLESPGSLTMEVQDVPGNLRRGARARHRHADRQYLGDARCSSRRSPPASTSAIIAATKYVGGHADVMLGAATATEALLHAHRADRLGPWPQRFARRRLARLARACGPWRCA